MPTAVIDVTRYCNPVCIIRHYDGAQSRVVLWETNGKKVFELWGILVSSDIDGEIFLSNTNQVITIPIQIEPMTPFVLSLHIPICKEKDIILFSSTIEGEHSIQLIGYEI